MLFRATPLRFQFRAVEEVHFPPGKAANTFRGALGLTLRKLVCHPNCQRVAQCSFRKECGYARIFEPMTDIGPSGFHDQPRPFVLRASALDGQTYRPGETFELEAVGFDPAISIVNHLGMAFRQLFQDGLGPGRARVELTKAEQLTDVELPFHTDENSDRIRIEFLTPTELKSGGETIREPRFEVLLARARDRVSSLCSIYQGWTPPFDFIGSNRRAAAVNLTAYSVREIHTDRRSSRTGQVHSLGGFIGTAEYEGDLGEFLPTLRAAEWTGVGRMTVWGNGRVVLRVESAR